MLDSFILFLIYIGSIHIADFRFFLRAYDIYLFIFFLSFVIYYIRYIVKKKQQKNYTISGMFSSAMEPVCGAAKVQTHLNKKPVVSSSTWRENSGMTERDNGPCPSLAQVFFFVFFGLCV